MKKNIIKFLFLLFLLSPIEALSIDLQIAKSKGWAGEKADGYLGVVIYSKEVSELVRSVNKQRKDKYSSISQKNKQPIDVVEKIAGAKLSQMVPKNQYYMSNKGKWIRK